MKKLLIYFSAGCTGGLAYSVAVSIVGDLGITSALGVSFHHGLSASWVYSRVVWGGIWGLVVFSVIVTVELVSQGYDSESVADCIPVICSFPTFYQSWNRRL